MKNEYESGGAGVMEEEEVGERGDARREIQALVDNAKEHMEEWKKGEAAEGYYPHVENLDPNAISDEDLDFWNEIKHGGVTPEDFYNRYDRPKEGELKDEGKEDKDTRAAFRALAAHMLDKQSLEKAEKEEMEPEKFK